MTNFYYLWYGCKRFSRYCLLTSLVGCVTWLPAFIFYLLPTVIIMSLALAIHDVMLAKQSTVFLPSFGPMYAYLLSWAFTISIVFFLVGLLILAIQGNL